MYEAVNFHVWGLYVCAVITSMCYMCGDVNFHAWGLYVCGAVSFYVGELYVWGVSFCMWGLYTCVGLTFRVLFPLPCWRKVSWCLCCCVSATYLRLLDSWTFKPFLVLHLLPPGVLGLRWMPHIQPSHGSGWYRQGVTLSSLPAQLKAFWLARKPLWHEFPRDFSRVLIAFLIVIFCCFGASLYLLSTGVIGLYHHFQI